MYRDLQMFNSSMNVVMLTCRHVFCPFVSTGQQTSIISKVESGPLDGIFVKKLSSFCGVGLLQLLLSYKQCLPIVDHQDKQTVVTDFYLRVKEHVNH